MFHCIKILLDSTLAGAARELGGGTRGAYWFVAAASTAVGGCVLAVEAPLAPKCAVADKGAEDGAEAAAAEQKTAIAAEGWAIAATTVFLALVVGTEISFGAFLVTYATAGGRSADHSVDARRGVSESEADLITTAFWAVFTLGRFAVAAVSRRVRPVGIPPTCHHHVTFVYRVYAAWFGVFTDGVADGHPGCTTAQN